MFDICSKPKIHIIDNNTVTIITDDYRIIRIHYDNDDINEYIYMTGKGISLDNVMDKLSDTELEQFYKKISNS